MRWRTWLAAPIVAGGVALAVGVGRFGDRLGPLAGLATASDSPIVGVAFVLGGGLLALLGALGAWRWRTRERAGPWIDAETVREREAVPVAGAETTAAVERWAADRDRGRLTHRLATDPADPVRERLRAVLAAGLPTAEDTERAIATGAWTADPIAAAYLGDDDRVAYPLAHRVAAWLDPETAADRRVRRAIGAVETALEDREDVSAPDRSVPAGWRAIWSPERDSE